MTAHDLDAETVDLVAANMPGWSAALGLCHDCRRRFSVAPKALRRQGLWRGGVGPTPILPTGLRLGANDAYRGRGVTIAFLDSGFFAHPDLVEPEDRILRYVDVTNRGARRRDLGQPEESSWHGMMTSVVACGNGTLSGGLYRGLASEANLVLVKCGTIRRIKHDDIRRGFDWVIRNRARYDIRVVNVSCGGDYEASYLRDGLSQAADEATREGIFVCAAAGNRGHLPGHGVLPPASAPSVLTVGGLDDKNRLSFSEYGMYHSSYGPTLDGLQKPEVIAPGIWVAAPILPGTSTAAQAELLTRLAKASDEEIDAVLAANPGVEPEIEAAGRLAPAMVRELAGTKLREQNVISAAYKHVDGTSFAAPIVSAIAAQMVEANPGLSPLQVKGILIRTARRLPGVDVERQGWGVVDAAQAVQQAFAAINPAPSEPRA